MKFSNKSLCMRSKTIKLKILIQVVKRKIVVLLYDKKLLKSAKRVKKWRKPRKENALQVLKLKFLLKKRTCRKEITLFIHGEMKKNMTVILLLRSTKNMMSKLNLKKWKKFDSLAHHQWLCFKEKLDSTNTILRDWKMITQNGPMLKPEQSLIFFGERNFQENLKWNKKVERSALVNKLSRETGLRQQDHPKTIWIFGELFLSSRKSIGSNKADLVNQDSIMSQRFQSRICFKKVHSLSSLTIHWASCTKADLNQPL